MQDEDGVEGGSGQATPVRDESPRPDSPAGIHMATEDDDYVSDGGEVEREVEQQEVEDDGEAEEMEREEVRVDGWFGLFKAEWRLILQEPGTCLLKICFAQQINKTKQKKKGKKSAKQQRQNHACAQMNRHFAIKCSIVFILIFKAKFC